MALYYFIDAAGERKLIGSGNIRWTGAWSGSTTYVARDAAAGTVPGHNWMALVGNTGIALPSTFTTAVPTTWSHLVQADTPTASPEDQAIAQANEAMALSTAALTTAWAGTAAVALVQGQSDAAIALAKTALTTSWVGTAAAAAVQGQADAALAVATAALETAWVGTNAPTAQAEAAMAVATTALDTSWVGTQLGDTAYRLATYAISLTGTTQVIDLSSVYAVAWSGTSTAHEAYDVALAALETAWIGTGAPTDLAVEAKAVATAALSTSWVGTSTAHEAYDIGRAALDTSWVGTQLANEAYGLATYAIALTGTTEVIDLSGVYAVAWSGTAAAAEAYNVALAALETAWIGTDATASQSEAAMAVATAALRTSWTGTSTAHEAYGIGKAALNTAWVGTNRADLAYNVAVTGTIGSQTIGVASGTAVLDMEGQVYQTIHITGDTTIVVTNQKAPTDSKVQGIVARLLSDTGSHTLWCDDFHWMTDPLASIAPNQTIFASFTSFGTSVNQIVASALIEDTRFLNIDANSLAAYSLARTALDTSWAGTSASATTNASATAAYNVGWTALETAWVGTSTAHEAYDIGRAALNTSWVGTGAATAAYNVGNTALATSWVGTGAASNAQSQADAALSVAKTALTTAWAGTDAPTSLAVEAMAVATAALRTSWTGTSTAHEAYDIGRVALDTSWVGTQLGNEAYGLATYAVSLAGTGGVGGDPTEAYNLGRTALDTAWVGTQLGNEAYGLATYAIALVGTATGTSSGGDPTEAYNLGRTALDTAWTGTALANQAYTLATYAVALAGTSTGTGSTTTGNDAIATAALTTAWAGTAAAHQAQAVATAGLETAWIGTNLATLADVTITGPTAAQNLVYDGSKWINRDPTSSVTPTAYTVYYEDTPSGISDYNTFTPLPTGVPEVIDTVSVGGANRGRFIEAYVTGTLARTYLSSGIWEFNHYASVNDPTRPAVMAWDVFVRTEAGAEQFWFSGTSSSITTTTATRDSITLVENARTVNPSDRVLVRLWAYRNNASTVNYSFYHNGGTHNSFIHTPFGIAHNDLPGLQGGQSGEYFHLTSDQQAAAVGSVGSPSSTNKFVTQSDPTLQAYGLATYAIAISGTGGVGGDPTAAYNLGRTALDTAWAGTISHNTLTPATGTLTFDMSGSAYQSAILTGATAITVKNIQAPTQTYIQAITARLQSNGAGTNYVVTWDAFSYLGSLPPATLVNNKSVFVSFTSFGTTIPNVFAAATSQV